MTALDFPAAPALNERYPTTPIAGVATYTWDGEKWIVINGDAGGGGDVIVGPVTGTAGDIAFTPTGTIEATNVQDAIVEVSNEAAAGGAFLPLTGGTLSGKLTVQDEIAATGLIYTDYNVACVGDVLAQGMQTTFARAHTGNTTPISDNELVCKLYVDALGGGGGGAFLPLTGGTLTGELTIAAPAFNSNLVMNAPDSTHSNFIYGKRAGLELWRLVMGASTTGDLSVMQFDDAGNFMPGGPPLNIAHTTGQVTVRSDPTVPLGVATKQYVDANAGGGGGAFLPLTGGTVTGDLRVEGASTFIDVLTAEGYIQCNGDLYSTGSVQISYDFIAGGESNNFPKAFGDGAAPTADNQYANKKYVDDAVSAASGGGAAATAITVVPVGNVAATNVQAAIQELDTEKVAKAGDTMTGQLTLPGTPSANLHAIHKGYVDGNFASVSFVNGQDALKVSKGGDTMTGALQVIAGTSAANSIHFGTVGTGFSGAASQIALATTGTQRINVGTTDTTFNNRISSAHAGAANNTSINFATSTTGFYGSGTALSASVNSANKLTIDAATVTTTVPVVLPADPSTNLQAATKQYVDNKPSTPDATKVLKAGDTMTGDLTIDKASPLIKLAKNATAQNNAIAGFNVGLPRWSLLLGTDDLESGGNAGSNFKLNRFSDAGAYVDTPIAVDRSTGAVTINADPTAALGIATKNYVDTRPVVDISNTVKNNVTTTISVGYTFTANNLGNITSFALNPALGNYQYGTNTAAFTMTAPAADCAVDILITNSATAGAITFSGFTVGANTGDALAVTNGQRFIISVRRIATISTYTIKALQ